MLYLFFPGIAKTQLTSADGEKLNRDFFASIPTLAELLAGVVDIPNHAMVSDTGKGAGPGGNSGAVVTLPPSDRPAEFIGFDPKGRQHWLDCGGWWLGCMKDAPPTPQDLERASQITGYLIKDGDGKEWRVPIARAPKYPYGTLPQFFTFSPTGATIANVAKTHLWLWELSGKIAETFAAEKAEAAQLAAWSLQILQVNYRIDRNVVNLLAELGRNILTTETTQATCRALYGFEIEEEIKKKYSLANGAGEPNPTPQS